MENMTHLRPLRVYFDLDISNEYNKNILKNITDDLSLYLHKLLKVRRCKYIQLLNTTIWHSKKIYNYDFYVLIKICSFNDSKLASTQTFTDEKNDYRPKASFIQIDENVIKSSSIYKDNPRYFFNFLAHEVFHALGISHNQFSMWIDPDSGLPYFKSKKNPVYSCTFPNISQEKEFISTKQIREFIKNKFGRENFGFNKNGSICPSGIEIEKDDKKNSKEKHIKSTVFPSEIMTPNVLGRENRIISEVTLTLLKSTGYYEVNMSMAENSNFLKGGTQKDRKKLIDLQKQRESLSKIFVRESSTDFIDKVFMNSIPSDFISIEKNSSITKISGCKFINIVTQENFMGRLYKENEFYNNIFEYTEDIVNPGIMHFDFLGRLTISTSTFKNFRYCNQNNQAVLFAVNTRINVTFEKCNFINIGSNNTPPILKMVSSSNLRMIKCSIEFDNCEKGSKLCDFMISEIYIDSCNFTRCPGDFIIIEHQTLKTKFVFANNVVEGNKNCFLNVYDLNYKPIIENNTFQNIEMSSGNLIVLCHSLNKIELFNNTFSHITTGTQLYGGGISSYYQQKNYDDMTIIYTNCKFYSITNTNRNVPYNQGGAIQYGYTTSISSTFLIFDECEFKRNKCMFGNGGALGINTNRDLTINRCLFENNESPNKGGALYVWCQIIRPSNNQNAPSFNGTILMKSISISNCTFVGNEAIQGYAIYIESSNSNDVKFDILSCNFTSNGQNKTDFMIKHACSDFSFINNNVEYTSAALFMNNMKMITMGNSNFKNCNSSINDTIYIILKKDDDSSITSVYNCSFINCIAFSYVLHVVNGSVEIDSCSVMFDDDNTSCGGFIFLCKNLIAHNLSVIGTNSVGGLRYLQSIGGEKTVIDRCTFERNFGLNTRCFHIVIDSHDFTFSNNVIKNLVETGNYGYSGGIYGRLLASNHHFVLENITFINNTCNSEYGGGIGIWIQVVRSITFKKCSFIKNTALRSPYPRPHIYLDVDYYSGDGGGIHFGFSPSYCNVSISFIECLFIQNKAVRHGGAIALQTTQIVEIINCVFEENIANYDANKSELLTYNNYYDLKSEGRGGAIYLNPSFANTRLDGKMISVTIEGCRFNSNKAFDGYAIYIEGDDFGTTFVINNNTFIDNYNLNTLSVNRSVVTSEIFHLYEGNVVVSNKFSYSNSNIDVHPLLYVDHYGNPFLETPSLSATPSNSLIETPTQEIVKTNEIITSSDENTIIVEEKTTFDRTSIQQQSKSSFFDQTFDTKSDVYIQSMIESDSKISNDNINDVNSNGSKNKKKYNLKSLILLIIILVEVISSVVLVIIIIVFVAKNKRYRDDLYMNINQDDDLSM